MSTLSDVLPPVAPAQDALQQPQPKQGALDRLKRRMENYRDMQSNRLPQYDQTMSQINVQQMQETKVLRQKFLESKAKKPNKKSSSSSSAEKLKQDMNAMSNMNGMMQYHGHANANLGPGGPPGHPTLGPPGHPGHMNHGNHGGSQQMLHHPSVPQKRPLEEDTKNTPDTAKRLNLENGNSSSDGSHNSVKREPSPLESKFQPGGNNFPSNSVHTSTTSNNNSGKHSADGSLADVKPVIKTEDTSADYKLPGSQEEADSKIKSEVDSLKQEADTLGDLDLKDFDGFDGMNTDTFQDLMDDLPEFDKNFYETLDFGDGKNGVDDGDDEKLINDAEAEAQLCHTSLPEGSQTSSVSSMGGTLPTSTSTSTQPNAAEALKMMAQQHQQPNMGMNGPPAPPSSMAGGPPFPPAGGAGQMYEDRNYPVPTCAMMDTRASEMNTTMAPTAPGAPGGMMMRPRMQDADPRLRAGVNPRYRLGNPTSIAGAQMPPGSIPSSMPSGQPGGMTEQQRMEMMRSNPSMMNMQNPSMSPNMNMMGQQVAIIFIQGCIMFFLLIFF